MAGKWEKLNGAKKPSHRKIASFSIPRVISDSADTELPHLYCGRRSKFSSSEKKLIKNKLFTTFALSHYSCMFQGRFEVRLYN